jgi:hypothetical protein
MQIYAIINIQRGGKDMQYKNITARGELQIICKLESCKFLMAAQAANFHYTRKLHF